MENKPDIRDTKQMEKNRCRTGGDDTVRQCPSNEFVIQAIIVFSKGEKGFYLDHPYHIRRSINMLYRFNL